MTDGNRPETADWGWASDRDLGPLGGVAAKLRDRNDPVDARIVERAVSWLTGPGVSDLAALHRVACDLLGAGLSDEAITVFRAWQGLGGVDTVESGPLGPVVGEAKRPV